MKHLARTESSGNGARVLAKCVFPRQGSWSLIGWGSSKNKGEIALNISFFSFFFCLMARGILAPQPGIPPCSLHWKCGVLITGPPGQSLLSLLDDVTETADPAQLCLILWLKCSMLEVPCSQTQVPRRGNLLASSCNILRPATVNQRCVYMGWEREEKK